MKEANKRRDRKRLIPALPCFKSAITNGSRLLEDVDGRSAWARRLRDLIADHVSDLGGEAALSSAERALVRRASMLCLQLELLESKFAQNDGGEASPKQLEAYARATGHLRRVLETTGLQRRSRDVTPDHSGGRFDDLINQVRGSP
jgi:hypothetical protein